MGFFKNLLRKVVNAGTDFTPDFSKSEYDNWLEFLAQGGTSDEWNVLKRVNGWSFEGNTRAVYVRRPTDATGSAQRQRATVAVFQRYLAEVTPVSDKYYKLLAKIQRNWSVLYNSKNYTGRSAAAFEQDCLNGIAYFKKMHEIDLKYGETSPQNIPAFCRLAMLYEKQERFEKSVTVCKEALIYGMDERSRMLRMIKKAGRSPSAEEEAALTAFEQTFMSNNTVQ